MAVTHVWRCPELHCTARVEQDATLPPPVCPHLLEELGWLAHEDGVHPEESDLPRMQRVYTVPGLSGSAVPTRMKGST